MTRLPMWLFWSALAAITLYVTQTISGCHVQTHVGGSPAIAGQSSTGGLLQSGGAASTLTGGNTATQTLHEPAFPPCMATETGGLEWSIPVTRALGWKRTTVEPKKATLFTGVLLSVMWQPNDLYTLDQGDVGRCVGYAWEDCLSTAPFPGHALATEGDDIYHEATVLDQITGTWPPDDTGSTVLAGAKAAVYLNRITGYDVATSVDEALVRLQRGPGVIGTDWREGMFITDNCGHLQVTGPIVGGHARELLGYDVARDRVWEMNSWGKFGVKNTAGRYGFQYLTRQELKDLFANGGEAYFPKTP